MTHASLLLLTAVFFGCLLVGPLWVVFVPCVCLAHRIGVLLHEYMHGLGFRRYRHNHLVVTVWDGVMLTCGGLEIMRGRHLEHHREVVRSTPAALPASSAHAGLDVVRYVAAFGDGLRGRLPYVHAGRVLAGALGTLVSAAFWIGIGRGDVLRDALAVVAFTVVVPVSLRSAIEHHGEPGATRLANDYRTAIPMFNVNRHIHHHEDATVPWYRLEWRMSPPLQASAYLTHWYRAHVTREFGPLPPPTSTDHRHP